MSSENSSIRRTKVNLTSKKVEKKPNVKELLAGAKKPALMAPAMHRFMKAKSKLCLNALYETLTISPFGTRQE